MNMKIKNKGIKILGNIQESLYIQDKTKSAYS